jgi:uncharacterized protein (DUF1778 family)
MQRKNAPKQSPKIRVRITQRPSSAREELIRVRVNTAERAQMERAAQRRGMSLSEWLRLVAREARNG